MYIILVYDICTIEKEGQNRLNKVMKLCRQYLHHTQKSVFEGELSEAKFIKLQNSIKNIIDFNNDYVIFYRIDNKNNVKKYNLGISFDPTTNIF
ncbi:CRISPR-associated endonuclease Cas2 [Nitratiruptor tergarcus]|uniref:CRISPR-associated endoribonuclease Cas2 n=1 Tax=Nitratiruptor tergarcus DSM 16512 TaxID=1069081 RepID=A0A1W1WRD8_9BACT|nr:CRISPR-associated endonuclease Cas2 [Nitratiruptor tergarcus]SMC08874.1 CRISPR-associated protein Cas2 [Nitratiruptor tergarcus DSM 16512]